MLVTGASAGIGRATALLMAARGARVVAISRTRSDLDSLARDTGGQRIAADLSDLKVVCLVLAIAAGATVLSHVNDSGFWLVSRFFGMDVKTTLRTWTVMETTLGLAIFGGLIVSQVLTLYTTPVIYLAFDRLGSRFRSKRAGVERANA